MQELISQLHNDLFHIYTKIHILKILGLISFESFQTLFEAEFDGVVIANFVKSVGLWEGLLNDSYMGGNPLTR